MRRTDNGRERMRSAVADRVREWKDGYDEGRLNESLRSERQPGIVSRLWSIQGACIAALCSVSLTLWLIVFALAALLFAPGCSDPGINAREDGAFQETESQLARYGTGLVNGTADLEHFKAFLHDALENLKTGERGERENAGLSWLDVILTALGGSGVVGGALHVLRNKTRESQLASLRTRLAALEEPPA